MDTECMSYGVIISIIVSALKRVPLVQNNAKKIALVLSSVQPILSMVLMMTGHSLSSGDWKQVATCVATQFTASVATHEVVTNSLRDWTETSSKPV